MMLITAPTTGRDDCEAMMLVDYKMIERCNFQYCWLLVLALAIQSCHLSRQNANNEYYPVIKVVDGDTFWIDDGSERGQKVRLIGVDAPETRRSARKEIGHYGEESKVYLTELLQGRDVRLEYDVSPKDRYGRTLAYVYLRDGTFLNALLVKAGYATVLTVPPNVQHADDFVKYQRQARGKGRGLWADQ